MVAYRIYLLDDQGKHGSGINAVCANDTDARAPAQRLIVTPEGFAEVWADDRLVGKVAFATAQSVKEEGNLWRKIVETFRGPADPKRKQ